MKSKDMEGYIKSVNPDGCVVWHKGLKPDAYKKERLDAVMSRCWDSLPDEKKDEINKKIDEKRMLEEHHKGGK